MIRRILASVIAGVLITSAAAVAVSADFATVDNYGLYYQDGVNVHKINVGDTIPSNKFPYSTRWSVSGLSPDYTYDIFLDVLTETAIDFTQLYITGTNTDLGVYYSVNNQYLYYNTGSSQWTKLPEFNGSIEQVSENHARFHIYYNYNISGLNYSSLQLCSNFGSYSGGIGNLKVVSTGVGAYYDPGGDTYLKLIYEYGAGYPVPDSAANKLGESVTKHQEAEGAVKNKSSELLDNVQPQVSVAVSNAKDYVNDLKPVSATVNTAFNGLFSTLPAPVQMILTIVPLLLFIGWLVGRVKE